MLLPEILAKFSLAPTSYEHKFIIHEFINLSEYRQFHPVLKIRY